MEENFLLNRSSRDEQFLGSLNQASLTGQRKSEQAKRRFSYADLHLEITSNASENHGKEEEIVKYMSNLPSYLERGSNFRENGFNFGVLDWGRLERWHCDQKPKPGRNGMSSSSSKELSLCSSNDLSSSLLRSRAVASSAGNTYPAVILPRGIDLKNRVLKPLQSDTFCGKRSFIRAERGSCKYTRCIEPEQTKDELQASQKNITKSSSLTGRAELYSEIPHPCQIPREGNRGQSPSKTRILCGKNWIRAPLDPAESKVNVEKSRSFSPFSRRSIGPNRKNKSSGSIEVSDIPRRSSQNALVSTNLDGSGNDKPRSSPLRRLLDPILKAKAGICHHSGAPKKDLIQKTRRSSNTAAKQATKVRLDMSRCRKIDDVNQAVEDKKRVSAMVQGLLQAVVKNGLPLLTFVVDDVSDVLAATMNSTGLEKDKARIYTFFTIREVKKKTGNWINQGGKQKGRSLISNVVAQMKVSEQQFSNSKFLAKEFVLFSVNPRLSGDQKNPDFDSDDELAAIVITNRRHSTGRETIFNTTVILPGGNHSIPNKGGPSSLIERWNSGGTCDCGGWDLGCRPRVLASSNRITKNSTTSHHYSLIDQLVLPSKEGEVENQPSLRMATLKDQIFSIEFGSTLSQIQAFAISIALLDSRNLCELSPGEKNHGQITAAHRRKPTVFDRIVEAPAEYISNPPPPSRFERV